MDKQDIIRMAQEAGLPSSDLYHGNLERFAALVAAAERERIKTANAPEIERVNAHIKALEDAVAAEREACAKVCEAWSEWSGSGLQTVAKAIRARGNA